MNQTNSTHKFHSLWHFDLSGDSTAFVFRISRNVANVESIRTKDSDFPWFRRVDAIHTLNDAIPGEASLRHWFNFAARAFVGLNANAISTLRTTRDENLGPAT